MESNVQKIREAARHLLCVIDEMGFKPWCADDPLAIACDKLDSALALPLRNCDVGTAEEQIDRFGDFCHSHRVYIDEFHGEDCDPDCPIAKLFKYGRRCHTRKETQMKANNMAELRNAAETALATIRGIISGTIARTNNSVFDCRDKLKSALSAPRRNCDMFGGDYKMLHTAWFDWTGSPDGHNDDGTAKMGFGEWLLALAGKRGAV